LHCLEKGFRDIFVCVGGSASTDGGSGLLRALGALWLDGQGLELGLGGGALAEIAACDLAKLERWRDVSITVATDVRSPLTGELGAAYIFAPQKGAAPEDVLTLDHALSKFADVLEAATDRFVRNLPGAGAAGGTAFGLACALNARIVPGFDWVADLTDLEAKIAASDLVITGEGCLDEQSLVGKATGELAALCQHYGTPLWVVPGRSAQSTNWLDYGIERVVPVSGGPEANNSEPADADAIARTVAALFA
jgi:glycerate kinase